jgi:localization factor PodJL
LRAIAAKVEETGAQLQAMAQSQSLAGRPDLPDLSALADLVAERTREAMPDGVASVGKTDLAALEDRLSKLFARAEAAPQDGEKLEGMKASIDRVDTRLERLEATLNGHGAPRTRTEQLPPVETEEIELKTAPKRRRGPASDTMPTDPVAEPTQTVAPKAPMPDAQAVRAAVGQEAAASEPAPFRIDPETIERPVKPQSSLDKTPETGFEAERRAEEPKRAAPPAMPPSVDAGPTVSRASFIEAARRAARQQADTAEPEEPKSLIGRAMARFQRSEAELVGDKDEKVPPAREAAPEPQLRSTPDSDADAEVDDRPKGFFARNKRPLLLSTALVIVLALAGNLVMQRLGANNANASQPATASVTAPEAAPTAEPEIAPEPATSEPAAAPAQEVSTAPASAVSEGLMSAQPLASQNADLAAGRPDAATMLEGIDPIQTASIGAEPIRYIPLAGRAAAEPVPTTQLPVISVPQDIGPAELRSAAEGGDARAQFEVGAILTEGHVVEQDFEAAAAWYERAAAQGFAPAQYRLGSLYEGGRGVERDLDQARLWYQQAAEAGNRMSMHNLASLYASGELGDQDFGAAAHWFEEAAARGLTDSQFNLGMLYARGLGVEQDFEQSYFWFTLAAEAGDEDAVGARDDVARSLDADAIQRIQSELSDWAPAEIEIATNFAPIGTWSESFDPGEAIANRDVVMRVQMILGKLGYEVGEPDGVVGPMTRDAIRGFERQAGMSESGVVNPRLLAVLGSQPV